MVGSVPEDEAFIADHKGGGQGHREKKEIELKLISTNTKINEDKIIGSSTSSQNDCFSQIQFTIAPIMSSIKERKGTAFRILLAIPPSISVGSKTTRNKHMVAKKYISTNGKIIFHFVLQNPKKSILERIKD